MPKITPFLWFDDQAEEAVAFYLSVFPDSRILQVARHGEGGPAPAGSVMTIRFELDGNEFGAERWASALRLRRVDLLLGRLHRRRGARPLLGGPHRRRGGDRVWLAQGSLRTALADRADRAPVPAR